MANVKSLFLCLTFECSLSNFFECQSLQSTLLFQPKAQEDHDKCHSHYYGQWCVDLYFVCFVYFACSRSIANEIASDTLAYKLIYAHYFSSYNIT